MVGQSRKRLLHLVVADIFLVRPCDTAYKVTKDSLDSQALLQQRRQAPPVGRALRILLGVALIVYVTRVYFQVPLGATAGSLLLILGLTAAYSHIHIGVSRRIVPFGPCLGASWRQVFSSRCML